MVRSRGKKEISMGWCDSMPRSEWLTFLIFHVLKIRWQGHDQRRLPHFEQKRCSYWLGPILDEVLPRLASMA